MGIFRMYTGGDGKSVIEELQVDDPILETLKTCTGCSIQINEPSEFSEFHPAPRRRWMSMISGQIDIELADGTDGLCEGIGDDGALVLNVDG